MTDPPEIILQKFPNSVTLDTSRAKWFLLATTMSAVLLVTISMYPRIRLDDQNTFLIGIALCAVAFVICAVQLLPSACMLTLDKDGLEVTSFFRPRRIQWQDASDFKVWTYRWSSFVIFNEKRTKVSVLSWLNYILAGRNNCLPDNFGLSAGALAKLLVDWQRLALQIDNPLKKHP